MSTFFVVCSVWELTELAALTEEEVETVVLDALEAVAADGAFIAALRTEVGRAPHLNDTLREHLDDMLEHAEKGEWVRASGQLYPGLEGAFWEVAYAHTVVTEERKDPRNTNKAIGFETMVKRLAIEQEFKTSWSTPCSVRPATPTGTEEPPAGTAAGAPRHGCARGLVRAVHQCPGADSSCAPQRASVAGGHRARPDAGSLPGD